MELRFDGLIGTGGIGSGRFFALDGDHTLGREESRSGRFLDRRDYCKLHIVAHYVQTLLGSPFRTVAIGRVGDDEAGAQLREEMFAAGIDIRHVSTGAGEQTMYALCFLYPDGSGGNLTVNDSASGRIDVSAVLAAEGEFRALGGRGIALALPEAPVDARRALLALGARHGLFCAASYTTAEILGQGRTRFAREDTEGAEDAVSTDPALSSLWQEDVDLLALNVDEAAALAGLPAGAAPETVVRAAAAAIRPGTLLTVTAGSRGSWLWDGAALAHQAALPVPVVGTAGAGDAHLAGFLVGLAIGLLPRDAHQLAALTAAVAVTSPHTINDRLDRAALLLCADETGLRLPAATREFLSGVAR
jgi:sugar/nucleoside kinase (ribokinase family)